LILISLSEINLGFYEFFSGSWTC